MRTDDFLFFIRGEIFRINLLPIPFVLEELCSTCRKEGQIHQAFVMGKIGEQLLIKLRPIASGDYGHFDDTEKGMQQCRHFSVKRRFTFGKCTVQIENNQLFHYPSRSEDRSSELQSLRHLVCRL